MMCFLIFTLWLCIAIHLHAGDLQAENHRLRRKLERREQLTKK